MNPQPEQPGLLSLRFISTVGIGLLFCILLVAYFFYGLQPIATDEGSVKNTTGRVLEVPSTVLFKITKGESFKNIAARLSQESLIRSISVFKVYSLFSGVAHRLQPGVYELSYKMSVPELVRTITARGKNEVVVTIPEGSTLKDIDSLLAEKGVTKRGTLIEYRGGNAQLNERYPYAFQYPSLEGFLFPDTYRMKIDSSVDDVVETLLYTFDKKAWQLLDGDEYWYDTLILASFLEREVPEFEDRQIVAGILLKRLKINIPLQVDATLSYIKCGGRARTCDDPRVARSDLTLASPYNTYQRLGWTPAPISNPGQAAIRAALDPTTNPYLYYLSSSKTKETIFSKTLEEHNRNRARYL